MRVLLDECVDRRLARDIVGHEVRTVPKMGWATIRNSDLLGLAEGQFDAFVTVDRNLAFHAREVCRRDYPPEVSVTKDHRANCWKVLERWDG